LKKAEETSDEEVLRAVTEKAASSVKARAAFFSLLLP